MAAVAQDGKPHLAPVGGALSWGVTPFVMEFDFIQPQNTIETAMKNLTAQGCLHPGDKLVIIGAISVGTEIVDAIQMRTV